MAVDAVSQTRFWRDRSPCPKSKPSLSPCVTSDTYQSVIENDASSSNSVTAKIRNISTDCSSEAFTPLSSTTSETESSGIFELHAKDHYPQTLNSIVAHQPLYNAKAPTKTRLGSDMAITSISWAKGSSPEDQKARREKRTRMARLDSKPSQAQGLLEECFTLEISTGVSRSTQTYPDPAFELNSPGIATKPYKLSFVDPEVFRGYRSAIKAERKWLQLSNGIKSPRLGAKQMEPGKHASPSLAVQLKDVNLLEMPPLDLSDPATEPAMASMVAIEADYSDMPNLFRKDNGEEDVDNKFDPDADMNGSGIPSQDKVHIQATIRAGTEDGCNKNKIPEGERSQEKGLVRGGLILRLRQLLAYQTHG
ncbi:uncharacterized protein CTRU02_205301 [Colletotrichum truncatum]|uniref:Uncharacterized protein n=1 Tax=Colletotrichum truncatum TaxID=5467 RepID=A0ACC3Z3L7_COLTU|nr:uncharacterized protein CTRU02_04357 [Colletotrichum truncatum]KAF6795547.1 hypothetical protein CTRU02_04357 [Colletotrichum truncatum]